MKKFETPAIELEKLDLMDVIATSPDPTTCWCDGYNEECPFEG